MTKFMALFGAAYGSFMLVSTRYDEVWLMERVKQGAGIHFMSYRSDEASVTDEEEEAIRRGARPAEPDWVPDDAWRAENMAPAKSFEERGIKILD